MAYFAQSDLENALGINTVKAIFDDDADGLADAAPIAACCEAGSVEVDAVLAGEYQIALPIANPPAVVKYAALDFGIAYAMRRRPDVVHAMNEKSWTEFREAALKKIELFASSFERLPAATGVPANVGGLAVDTSSRIILDGSDGTANGGDF